MTSKRASITLAAFVAVACATSNSKEAPALLGSAIIAIAESPPGTECLRIRVDGENQIERLFALDQAGPNVFTVEDLPVGEASFSGAAYDVGCNELSPAIAATWASEPVSAMIVSGPLPIMVRLLLRRNEDDGGVDAGTDPDGGETNPDVVPYVQLLKGGEARSVRRGAVIDWENRKLLLLALRTWNTARRPWLYRCALDGTNCTASDATAGFYGETWVTTPAIDHSNQKVLFSAAGYSVEDPSQPHALLFRCELDGTACDYTELTAGLPAGFIEFVGSVLIDEAQRAVLVPTIRPWNGGGGIELFRCSLEGDSCRHASIWSPPEPQSGIIGAFIDEVESSLLIVIAEQRSFQVRPALLRCTTTGSSCTYVRLSEATSLVTMSAGFDQTNRKLLIVGNDQSNQSRPTLLRCAIDGTVCDALDISAGQPLGSGYSPFAVHSEQSKQLYVAATNHYDFSQTARLGLFRCRSDGAECAYQDLSGERETLVGTEPFLLLNEPDRRVLVFSQDATYGLILQIVTM